MIWFISDYKYQGYLAVKSEYLELRIQDLPVSRPGGEGHLSNSSVPIAMIG